MSYGNPTGFVSFDRYLQANEEGAEEMAQRAGQAATNGAAGNPADLQRNVGMLGTQQGAQAFLQKATPKGGKTSALDAALAGQGGYFAQLQKQYGHAGDEDLRRRLEAVKAPQQAPQGARDIGAEVAASAQSDMGRQAAAMRAEDARRPSGQMGRERWANLHGMTLEQWIAAGQRPAF